MSFPSTRPAQGLFPGLAQEPLVQTLFSVHLDTPQPLTQIPGFLFWLLWWLLKETGRLPSSRVLEYVCNLHRAAQGEWPPSHPRKERAKLHPGFSDVRAKLFDGSAYSVTAE